jgi:hypothetical protein
MNPGSRFPDAPPQIQALKIDARGYPVPFFVEWIDGEPEFRATSNQKVHRAHQERLCWVCGRRRAGLAAFVVGPMCGVNRVSSEPPSHPGCARFAATACPFLTRPLAKRRHSDKPPHRPPAGIMIERNPGVTLIWLCRTYRVQRERDGLLFRLGHPARVEWYSEGRKATRAEVLESIRTGLPTLAEIAQQDGYEAVKLLQTMAQRVMKFVPEES